MISDKAKEQLADAVNMMDKSYKLQGYLMDAKTMFGDGSRFSDLGFHHFSIVHRTFENALNEKNAEAFDDSQYAPEARQ